MVLAGINYGAMATNATSSVYAGMDSLINLSMLTGTGKISIFEAHEREKAIVGNNLMCDTFSKIAEALEASEAKNKKQLEKDMRDRYTLSGS
jgi:hypothetical protein